MAYPHVTEHECAVCPAGPGWGGGAGGGLTERHRLSEETGHGQTWPHTLSGGLGPLRLISRVWKGEPREDSQPLPSSLSAQVGGSLGLAGELPSGGRHQTAVDQWCLTSSPPEL